MMAASIPQASLLFRKIFDSTSRYNLVGIRQVSRRNPDLPPLKKKKYGQYKVDGDIVTSGTILARHSRLTYCAGLNTGFNSGYVYAKVPGRVMITTELTDFEPEHTLVKKYFQDETTKVMALRLAPPGRTQGDGMEKPDSEKPAEHTIILQPKMHTDPSNSNSENADSCGKPETSTLAIKLTPQSVNKKKKDFLISLKNKEPKFVPFEPYKAAVKPIVPNEKKHFRQLKKKNSNDLAAIFKHEKKESKNKESKKEVQEKEDNCWENKFKSLEQELQVLKEENEQLENQLKFQVQVNGELKNLLVAAVGEDMETKVHVLTEDKLHLAQALLKSAKSLSSHQEQTEWLAGQCEVWRSKFLASSVMVEELARWKAALMQKVNEAQDALKKLLEERKLVRQHLTKTYNNLKLLRDNFDLLNKNKTLSSGNVIDLSEENFKMSEVLLIQLLGIDTQTTSVSDVTKDLPNETAAEKAAENMITNPHLLKFGEPDAACNAVVGAAVALSGQLYLESHRPAIECCSQCSGDIKLI